MNPQSVEIISPEDESKLMVTEPQMATHDELQVEYTRLGKEYGHLVAIKAPLGARRRIRKQMIKTSKKIMQRIEAAE